MESVIYGNNRHKLLVAILLISVALLAVMLFITRDEGKPEVSAVGAVSAEVLYHGGSAVESVALADVTLTPADGGVEVALSFADVSADGALTPTFRLPEYIAFRHHDPERVAIQVKSLADTGGPRFLSLPAHQLISGAYVVGDTIYLQTTSPVNVSLEGAVGKLLMRFTPRPLSAMPGYVALMDAVTSYNATDAYNELVGLGMRPALCGDGRTLLMASDKFQKKSTAEAFAGTARKAAYNFGLMAEPWVYYHSGAGFAPALDYTGVNGYGLNDAGGVSFRLLMRDANLTSVASNGDMLIRRSDDNAALLHSNLSRTPLPGEWSHMSSLSLSPNGANVAALNVSGELVAARVADGVRRVLGEPVTQDAQFVWYGNDELVISTGEPPIMYSLNVAENFYNRPSESGMASLRVVDERPGVQGAFWPVPGSIIYQDEIGRIFRIDMATKKRFFIAIADEFSASRDGSAIVTRSGKGAYSTLMWHSLRDESRYIIGMNMNVCGFAIEASGVYAFIILGGSNGERAKLYKYVPGGEPQYICAVPKGRLIEAAGRNAALLNFMESDGSWSLYSIQY